MNEKTEPKEQDTGLSEEGGESIEPEEPIGEEAETDEGAEQGEEGGEEEGEEAPKSEEITDEELEGIIESVLFTAENPLKTGDISAIIDPVGSVKERVKEALEKLRGKYPEEGAGGIMLKQVAGGWQFRTNPRNARYILKFYQKKPRRLSSAALEVLAIIAYRQPITRGEIEEIRGVDPSAIVRALLDRKLIRIIGHRDEPGKPLLYATTSHFLELVGINQLSQLPTLEEYMELTEESRAKIAEEVPETDETAKQNIISELIARQFAKMKSEEETDKEGEEALSDLDDAVKEMEKTFKDVAGAVGLNVQHEQASAEQGQAAGGEAQNLATETGEETPQGVRERDESVEQSEEEPLEPEEEIGEEEDRAAEIDIEERN